MLSGTRRAVFEALVEQPKSATDISDELDTSIQTVSRHLRSLEDEGYVVEAGTRAGETRPYKLYEPAKFARVFASYDHTLVDQTVDLTPAHEALLSILQVPQPEFHSALIAEVFSLDGEYGWNQIESIAVYGSVARGDANEESDVDMLFVVEDGVNTDEIATDETMVNLELAIPEFGTPRMVSHSWFSESEIVDGLEAGSQFLRNALDEAIILYDKESILRNIVTEYVEEGPS